MHYLLYLFSSPCTLYFFLSIFRYFGPARRNDQVAQTYLSKEWVQSYASWYSRNLSFDQVTVQGFNTVINLCNTDTLFCFAIFQFYNCHIDTYSNLMDRNSRKIQYNLYKQCKIISSAVNINSFLIIYISSQASQI